MRVATLLPVFIIMLLVIISRKHYSKYKDGKDPIWNVASMLTEHLSTGIKTSLQKYIRNTVTLNGKHLVEARDKYLINLIHNTLILLIVISMLFFLLTFIPKEEAGNTISRSDVGGDSQFIDLELRDNETSEIERYKLEIFPREYSKEEFDNASSKAKEFIDKLFLGVNTADTCVSHDLVFPKSDEAGTLSINWSTDASDIVNSTGQVSTDFEGDFEIVNITAEIKDGNFSDEYKRQVTVVKAEQLSGSELAKEALENIEKDRRFESEVDIPESIGHIDINRNTISRQDVISIMYVLALLLVPLIIYHKINGLKEIGLKRRQSLYDSYFSFVNRLAIYIGAGQTIKEALRSSINHETNDYLKSEIELALNRVNTGASEYKAYSELGENLGLQEYVRLMSIITQNLSYGNSNLIKLLDSEVKTIFNLKRENIRKRGEVASEKLLIPTGILLLLVIVIVMYPAFITL